MVRGARAVIAVLLFALLPGPLPQRATAQGDSHVVIAVGDIASCALSGDERTGRLVDTIDHEAVLTLGDHAYERGTDSEFERCFAPPWGRHRALTRPTPGNHDLAADGGAPYYRYFADAAGPQGRGWYSFDLGPWHVVSLNSNCVAVDCRASSPQLRWLRADLAASAAPCTLAFWHHPRFSSGSHRSTPAVKPFFDALFAAGADLVLAGHDHDYEQFAPMTPAGAVDRARGIRSFVVGTGGASLRKFGSVVPGSELRIAKRHGVLVLELRPGDYRWEFRSVDGRVLDRGQGGCH